MYVCAFINIMCDIISHNLRNFHTSAVHVLVQKGHRLKFALHVIKLNV